MKTPMTETLATKATTLAVKATTHSAVLLAHPDVVRAIEGSLRRQGVHREDLSDGVAETQLRALEATADGPCPTDVDGWKALACTIAKRMAIKERLRRKARSLYHAGLCEDPDEHAPIERSPGRDCEPLDVRRELATATTGLHDEAILLGVAEGASARDIGSQLGLTEAHVRRRLLDIRKKVRNRHAASD
ncbi:MAG TPA: hypothetical protein VGL81_28800 [Polyangiaceae bacterium]|jgi:DNA-directed RNA polymerase specialized sigma24 family protein